MRNKGNKVNWSDTIDWQVACHRAGGRRGYNVTRQVGALLRQRQLVTLLRRPGLGLTDRGAQAAIARRLGVHRSTIHRDIRALQRDFWDRRRRDRMSRGSGHG